MYRRYAVEIVEGLSFCPYAERARVDGHTREVVVLAPLPTDDAVAAEVEAIADDDEVEIGLVILPRLTLSRAGLGRWVEVLRKRHAATRGRAVLAIEGFHPDAAANTSSPERLTPFVRRTPDPTLQLTRLDALERVRRGSPTGTGYVDLATVDLAALAAQLERRPLHERIAELNLATVEREGVAAIEARLEDIVADRDRSYRAIDPSIVMRGRAAE